MADRAGSPVIMARAAGAGGSLRPTLCDVGGSGHRRRPPRARERWQEGDQVKASVYLSYSRESRAATPIASRRDGKAKAHN